VPVIPELGRLRQENNKFEACQGYITRVLTLYPKKKEITSVNINNFCLSIIL
jgi:hypothetical protein